MGRSKRSWDVIVVGARVAGATLAAYLGRAGLRTLLIDRVRFPAYVPRQGSCVPLRIRRKAVLRIQTRSQTGTRSSAAPRKPSSSSG